MRPRSWSRANALPLGAAVLAGINLFVCRELLWVPQAHMNSMQGFWIAIAKHAGAAWFKGGWWPYWDGGIPFEFTYAPLVPGSISALSATAHIPESLALQWIMLAVYCLAPSILFVVFAGLTKHAGASFAASLFYSLSSPAQLLAAGADPQIDKFRAARRLYIVTIWDDLPHAAALALIPLAVLFLYRSLLNRRHLDYVLAIATLAGMALASAFGPMLALLAAVCLLGALPERSSRHDLMLVAGLGGFAYLLVCPFLSPSLLVAIRSASASREAGWSAASVAWSAALLGAWVLLRYWLNQWLVDWVLRFVALFAFLVSAPVIIWTRFHLLLTPQPDRLKLEMDLALCLLVVFSLRELFVRLPLPVRIPSMLTIAALAVFQIAGHRAMATGILQEHDVQQTIEYKTADWVAKNLPDTRVMFSGSVAQWADAYTTVPQFGGSSWSMAYNQVQQRALAAVYNSGHPIPERQDPNVSLAWLKAFGAGAIAVSGPSSSEYWKAFGYPLKFEGVLPRLWSQDDVTVYRIPRRSPSLAFVLPESDLVQRPVTYVLDLAALQPYLSALEDRALPEARFQWVGNNRMHIETVALEGQAISVQVSYHPGWHARANGASAKVFRDGLGLMWIRSGCKGPCDVTLQYDSGWELRICRWLSYTALLSLMLWIGRLARANVLTLRMSS